jgi:type IV pilus assembly protein PilY1
MDLRLNGLTRCLALLAVTFLLGPDLARAQQTYKEDFTQSVANLQWFASGGTCLTAGTLTAPPTNPPSKNIIGCTANLTAYYSLTTLLDKALVGGSTGTFPDAAGSGALRFTNGYPYAQNQRGSLVSGFYFPTAQGISLSFNTVTYLGDSGGDGADGADGISFFLMDACVPIPGATLPSGCKSGYGTTGYSPIGAIGGSLGYSCSNHNLIADGVPGAYLGLGIDEYGNFLNGVNNSVNDPNGYHNSTHGDDNTYTGGFYDPGRIGLRGAGNVNWQYLNQLYGTDPGAGSTTPYYPGPLGGCPAGNGVYDSTKGWCETCKGGGTYNATTHSCPNNAQITDHASITTLQMQQTCSTGYLYNFSSKNRTPQQTSTAIADYPAIAAGFTSTTGVSGIGAIAAETAATRGAATPIVYNLQITPGPKLSFQLSYNGGAYKNILTDTDISTASGTIPDNVRFGFTGATGGSTNIHELLCFQVAPNKLAASGAGNNNFQNPQLIPNEQLFLGSYYPTQAWAGSVTAQNVGFNTATKTVQISPVLNWDASCVLTKEASCPSGAPNTPKEAAASRQILTYNNGKAYAFEYSSLPANLKTALDGDDPAASPGIRVDYLHGVQHNELSDPDGNGLKLFRTRTSVLGDVIDSTPTLVGPPSTYPSNITWADLTQPGTTQNEQLAAADTYATFQSAKLTRMNVVYVGANDGLLHGFRAGAFNSKNVFDTTTYANDGYEVLAYMPGVVASTIHNTANTSLDPSSPGYTHAYFVDATPATGDVFYGTHWHTWLVGGLGAGATPGVYALDVTDPSTFSEGNTATVIGEWTPSSSCTNSSTCGQSMGSISGTPQIRRFHNGKWGVVFGNGVNSASGDAGIFIMLLDQTLGTPSLIYLSTGMSAVKGAKPDGIPAVSAADIDGDHIVDFVYAGDIQGNVWRFDLTDPSELNWGKSLYSPLFTEPHGLPITTKVAVSTLRRIVTRLGLDAAVTRDAERVVINFATGSMTPQSTSTPTQYAAGPHYIYGIWDADMSRWNAQNNSKPVQPVVSFAASTAVPTIKNTNNLQVQTITTSSSGGINYRTITQNTVCWPPDPPGTPNSNPLDSVANCTPVNQMGWWEMLPGSGGADPTLDEQVIFDPIIAPDGEFIVNTFIPANISPLQCQIPTPTGFTMALDPGTGGGSPLPFFVIVNGQLNADGIQLNGTGVPLLVQSGQSADMNAQYLITQTSNGQPAPPNATNQHVVVTGERLNWIERR